MTQPLMPKATAVWLIDNTALTYNINLAISAGGDNSNVYFSVNKFKWSKLKPTSIHSFENFTVSNV